MLNACAQNHNWSRLYHTRVNEVHSLGRHSYKKKSSAMVKVYEAMRGTLSVCRSVAGSFLVM
jgi:hypothetical protein